MEINRVELAAIDVTDWTDLEGFRPGDLQLAQPVSTASVSIIDHDGTLPIAVREGLEIAIYDDTDELVFGGYVANVKALSQTGLQQWDLECNDWNVRLQETILGSLDRSGVLDTDRNFVIEILRAGLSDLSFGAATGVDDVIVSANEPDWPGVQGTAVISGVDWTGKRTGDALEDLKKRVPNVFHRIGPDKVVEYGVPVERAGVVLVSMPSAARGVGFIEYEEYEEEVLVAGHVNKLTRGGEGGASVTATDEVSFGRVHRVIEDPFEDDEDVPASDLERLAYAELKSKPIRRQIRVVTSDAPRVKPGQIVAVVCDQFGPFEPDGPYPDALLAIDAPSPTGEPVDAWRGEFVVQGVSRQMIGGSQVGHELVLGDYVPEFSAALARKAASS